MLVSSLLVVFTPFVFATFQLVPNTQNASQVVCQTSGTQFYAAANAFINGTLNLSASATRNNFPPATLISSSVNGKVITSDGTNVWISTDGVNFKQSTLPASNVANFTGISAVSASSGYYAIAMTSNPGFGSAIYGEIFTSMDGNNWVDAGVGGVGPFQSLIISNDGYKIAATYPYSRMNGPGKLMTIVNNVTNQDPSQSLPPDATRWTGLAVSTDGAQLIACRGTGYPAYASANWGRDWVNVSHSCDQVAVGGSSAWISDSGQTLWTTNGGQQWNVEPSLTNISSLALSSTGKTIYAANKTGVYVQGPAPNGVIRHSISFPLLSLLFLIL